MIVWFSVKPVALQRFDLEWEWTFLSTKAVNNGEQTNISPLFFLRGSKMLREAIQQLVSVSSNLIITCYRNRMVLYTWEHKSYISLLNYYLMRKNRSTDPLAKVISLFSEEVLFLVDKTSSEKSDKWIPAYGVYISQLRCYSRACAKCRYFLDIAQLLTQKLLKQGYVASTLKL